jgi:hypothetical protein
MKIFSFVLCLFSFLCFLSCATTPPLADAEKTASAWEEIYECVRTAPPGKNCGNQFKSRIYTVKVSSIQKDKSGQAQLVTRFGSGDKSFTCELINEHVDQFAPGDVIQFEGTVIGIHAKPMQRSVEFKDCNIRKL